MIQVHQLTFAYKNRPLFQNLSFEIKSGTLTRLTGPNGAGKSTLLGLISGIIPGGRHSITMENQDSFKAWASWIAPDANGLFPTLSAQANIVFWLQVRGLTLEASEISETLDRWGLCGPWIQSKLPVSKFSTGMRRRLSLVRLILEKSKLWLLDEPLFGLDDQACKLFREHLTMHINSGGTAIVVTHDDRLIESLPHQSIKIGGSSQ